MKPRRAAVFLSLVAALTLRAEEPKKAAAPAPPFAIRVTLLGTGNPRPSMSRFGPSILVEAATSPPTRILVDAGRGAALRLFSIGGRDLLAGIDLVLLTHLHSDHVVGLPDLWLTGWLFGRASPFSLKGPEGTAALMAHLEKAFEFDVRVRRDIDERLPGKGAEVDAREIPPETAVGISGVKISAFAVEHGPVKPAYGYRIEFAGKSVVLSGDTRYSENLVAHAKGCDVLVHEVVAPEAERRHAQVRDRAAIQRIIDHHTTPEDAGKVFAEVKPGLAVYSHIVPSPAVEKDLVAPTRRTYSGPLAVGYDLMSISIGERIAVEKRAAAVE
ncbi:MAG: MBL fold metallo-hydrolase [Thermoanaerobaculia bacterium]|nr:MBL fold metallo-hydrolase [Thermoanaerobaculia bacterium]